MPLQHTLSSASMDSFAKTVDSTSPSGPFSGPSHTTWRRQRLLRIGSNNNTPRLPFDADESSFLTLDQTSASYGTLPARRESPVSFRSSRHLFKRRNLPALPGLTLPRVSSSQPATPQSPSSFRGLSSSYFRINTQRPISAYDAPLVDHTAHEDDLHARTNGIRVWYSSFASIDWLHDAIKDSVRFSRLRRGKSLHSKIRLLLDKSIGWIVVTLVGFITALVAFLIIRGEQWFFDLKEGHCSTDWKKAKRFCCPIQDDDLGTNTIYMGAMQGTCPAWRTWAEVLGASERGERMIGYRADLVQYIAYTFIAVCPCYRVCVLPNLTHVSHSYY
jgi:chloride channel 3/4/5